MAPGFTSDKGAVACAAIRAVADVMVVAAVGAATGSVVNAVLGVVSSNVAAACIEAGGASGTTVITPSGTCSRFAASAA